jgi:hypothetical protein
MIRERRRTGVDGAGPVHALQDPAAVAGSAGRRNRGMNTRATIAPRVHRSWWWTTERDPAAHRARARPPFVGRGRQSNGLEALNRTRTHPTIVTMT